MQLQFIIMLMAASAHQCISVESHQITPFIIRSDASSICPSEIMRDNALQLVRDIISAKISNISNFISTEPPTEGTTSTNIPTTTVTTASTTVTTTSVTPFVLLQSNLFGGTGGDYFDDHNDNIAGIVGMRIRAGDQVNSIQVTYWLKDGSTYTAPMRGRTGSGGTEYSFTLADGEKLTRMEGMTSGPGVFIVIDMLTFYSNMNNVYGPYGMTGQTRFSIAATEIVAFFGRFGSLLDAIGAYYTN